jgi:hypothetical protein
MPHSDLPASYEATGQPTQNRNTCEYRMWKAFHAAKMSDAAENDRLPNWLGHHGSGSEQWYTKGAKRRVAEH